MNRMLNAAHSLNSRGSSSLRRETSFVKIAGSNPSCYKYRNIYEYDKN